VSTTSPSFFYYFSKLTAPSSSFTVNVVETKDVSTFKLISAIKGQIFLLNASCGSFKSGSKTATGAKIDVTGATPGNTYIVSVKFDFRTIKNSTFSGSPPAVHYAFSTDINSGTQFAKDTLLAKGCPLSPSAFAGAALTEVEKEKSGAAIPTEFDLHQNYPNPFNPSTDIQFDLPQNSRVKVAIYDILGNEVKVLVDGDWSAGVHHATWTGENNAGQQVPSGVYFYRIAVQGAGENGEATSKFSTIKKMLFVK
jgi:hypothetical protein